MWWAVAAASPWSWFALRDRGPVFDLVATGFPALVAGLAAAAAIWAVVRRRLAPALVAASLLMLGSAVVLAPWSPQAQEAPVNPLRVVAANADRGNADGARAAVDILRQRADLVVVVEGGARVRDHLVSHYAFAASRPTGDPLLLSRYPVQAVPFPPGRHPGGDVSRWQLTTGSGTVVVYAVHLDRPRITDSSVLTRVRAQRAEVLALLGALRNERLPTLLVGDFNMSDRSSTYRRLTSSLPDAARARWAGPTYVGLRYLPLLLRIDHIFMPRAWCSQRSARFAIRGSDHRGVVAEVGPCRTPRGDGRRASQAELGGRALAP